MVVDRVERPFSWLGAKFEGHTSHAEQADSLESNWYEMVQGQVWDNDCVVATLGDRSLEAPMGNKDKGGRHTKTAAIKNLKEKRQEKKAKRTAADAKRDRAD